MLHTYNNTDINGGIVNNRPKELFCFQKLVSAPETVSAIRHCMSRVICRYRTSPGPRRIRFTAFISVMGAVTSEDDHPWG